MRSAARALRGKAAAKLPPARRAELQAVVAAHLAGGEAAAAAEPPTEAQLAAADEEAERATARGARAYCNNVVVDMTFRGECFSYALVCATCESVRQCDLW